MMYLLISVAIAIIMILLLPVLIKIDPNKKKTGFLIITIFFVVGTFFLFIGALENGILDKMLPELNLIS